MAKLTVEEITGRGVDKYEDPNTSVWFRTAILEAFRRNPVDAASDAKALAKFLSWRAKALSRTQEGAG